MDDIKKAQDRGAIVPDNLVPFALAGIPKPPRALDPLGALFAPFEDGLQATLAGLGTFKVDLRETDEGYDLKADFPGFAKDDVDVKISDDVITVSCKQKSEIEEGEDGKWLAQERTYVSAERSFTLRGADEKRATASLEDGVLTVHVPKKQEAASTSIEIS